MNEQLVSERVGQIDFLLSEYEQKKELPLLLRALREISGLRDDYRIHPEAFGPHLPRLKDLGASVRERLSARADEVAAAYQAMVQRQDAVKAACALYRDAVREVCLARGEESSKLAEGRVTAKRFEGLRLPEARTKARESLEAFLKERGLWSQASMISASRITALLKSEDLPPEDREGLEKLCIRESSYRINVARLSPQAREQDLWAEAGALPAAPGPEAGEE